MAAESVSAVAERRVVLVLGMHRSGTSAMTRVINLLGADIASRLMPQVPGINEAGFWESLDLVQLNDEALASAGSYWDDLSEFPHAWFGSDIARTLRLRAVELLRQDFEHSPLFVLKDPRISRLLPFWLQILDDFGADPAVILMLRNPLETASSLKLRDGFPVAKSLLLWLRHLLSIERESRRLRRVFVGYEQLLRDWRGVSSRISRQLQLEWPRLSHRSGIRIESFISGRLRHHRFSTDEVDSRDDVISWVKQLYRVAQGATEQRAEDLSAVFDAVREDLDRADRAFGPIVESGRRELEKACEASDLVKRELAAVEEKLRVCEAELESSRADRATGQVTVEELKSELAARDNEIESLRSESAALGNAWRESEAAAEEKSERDRIEIERLQARLEAAESRCRELAQTREALGLETDRLAQQLAAERQARGTWQRRVGVRDRELDRHARKLDKMDERHKELAALLGAARGESQRHLQAILEALDRLPE